MRSTSKRIALEAGVIVASILLAFSLDALWNEHTEQTELRTMLTLVAEEVAETRSS